MRSFVLWILTVLLLFSMFNAIPVVSRAIIRVPQDYPTIKEAIGAASLEDIIIVSEGTYKEGQIMVNKSLTLIANGTVVVDGLHEGHVFYVTANNVTINGFIIKNSRHERSYAGIFLEEVQKCNLSNNRLMYNWYGVILVKSSYNTLAGNIVTNNLFYGIMLHDIYQGIPSQGNNLIWNNVTNNTEGGILLENSGGNTLKYNTISGSRYNFGVYGSFLIRDFINDIDTSNVVNEKVVYYLINQKNLKINHSTFPDIDTLEL